MGQIVPNFDHTQPLPRFFCIIGIPPWALFEGIEQMKHKISATVFEMEKLIHLNTLPLQIVGKIIALLFVDYLPSIVL